MDEIDAGNSASAYVIRGGRPGRERLRLLARVTEPTTRALLERLDLRPGMTCLDVGCGGGDVTRLLADAVGEDGRVWGLDVDPTVLEIARAEAMAAQLRQVLLRVADDAVWQEVPPCDLAYARFVLTHLRDPLALLRRMRAAARPGGLVVIEDIDFRGHFCHPESPGFARYLELYTRVVRLRGGDPNIGPRLPGLLRAIGCIEIHMQVAQPAGIDGEVKLIAAATMENIADALLQQGVATADEIAGIVAELYAIGQDGSSVMSVPRIIQAWGRVPASSHG